MPAISDPDITLNEKLWIGEVSVATGIPERKIHRLIDDGVLPRSVCAKVGKRRALRAFAVPMVVFGASDGARLSKSMRLAAMRRIGEFVKANWRRLRERPECAATLGLESGCISVALGKSVTEAFAGLNKWAKARMRIVEDPDIRGGLPVLSGTRVGVYEAASSLAVDGMEAVLENLPSLNREDLEVAAMFAKAFPPVRRPRIPPANRRLVSEVKVPWPVLA